MEKRDIRWQQRFSNYQKALVKLSQVVDLAAEEELSELEKEGMIQRFEYTYELAWKTLQDLLHHRGYQDIIGPNPTLSQAYADGLISNAEVWKGMKSSRELTSHTYNSETAESIAELILESYYDEFKNLEKRLLDEMNSNQASLFS